jgi:hypothetical protein
MLCLVVRSMSYTLRGLGCPSSGQAVGALHAISTGQARFRRLRAQSRACERSVSRHPPLYLSRCSGPAQRLSAQSGETLRSVSGDVADQLRDPPLSLATPFAQSRETLRSVSRDVADQLRDSSLSLGRLSAQSCDTLRSVSAPCWHGLGVHADGLHAEAHGLEGLSAYSPKGERSVFRA